MADKITQCNYFDVLCRSVTSGETPKIENDSCQRILTPATDGYPSVSQLTKILSRLFTVDKNKRVFVYYSDPQSSLHLIYPSTTEKKWDEIVQNQQISGDGPMHKTFNLLFCPKHKYKEDKFGAIEFSSLNFKAVKATLVSLKADDERRNSAIDVNQNQQNEPQNEDSTPIVQGDNENAENVPEIGGDCQESSEFITEKNVNGIPRSDSAPDTKTTPRAIVELGESSVDLPAGDSSAVVDAHPESYYIPDNPQNGMEQGAVDLNPGGTGTFRQSDIEAESYFMPDAPYTMRVGDSMAYRTEEESLAEPNKQSTSTFPVPATLSEAAEPLSSDSGTDVGTRHAVQSEGGARGLSPTETYYPRTEEDDTDHGLPDNLSAPEDIPEDSQNSRTAVAESFQQSVTYCLDVVCRQMLNSGPKATVPRFEDFHRMLVQVTERNALNYALLMRLLKEVFKADRDTKCYIYHIAKDGQLALVANIDMYDQLMTYAEVLEDGHLFLNLLFSLKHRYAVEKHGEIDVGQYDFASRVVTKICQRTRSQQNSVLESEHSFDGFPSLINTKRASLAAEDDVAASNAKPRSGHQTALPNDQPESNEETAEKENADVQHHSLPNERTAHDPLASNSSGDQKYGIFRSSSAPQRVDQGYIVHSDESRDRVDADLSDGPSIVETLDPGAHGNQPETVPSNTANEPVDPEKDRQVSQNEPGTSFAQNETLHATIDTANANTQEVTGLETPSENASGLSIAQMEALFCRLYSSISAQMQAQMRHEIGAILCEQVPQMIEQFLSLRQDPISAHMSESYSPQLDQILELVTEQIPNLVEDYLNRRRKANEQSGSTELAGNKRSVGEAPNFHDESVSEDMVLVSKTSEDASNPNGVNVLGSSETVEINEDKHSRQQESETGHSDKPGTSELPACSPVLDETLKSEAEMVNALEEQKQTVKLPVENQLNTVVTSSQPVSDSVENDEIDVGSNRNVKTDERNGFASNIILDSNLDNSEGEILRSPLDEKDVKTTENSEDSTTNLNASNIVPILTSSLIEETSSGFSDFTGKILSDDIGKCCCPAGSMVKRQFFVTNTGKESWPEGFALILKGGEHFSVSHNQFALQPGHTAELFLRIQTPNTAGSYNLNFAMHDLHDNVLLKFGLEVVLFHVENVVPSQADNDTFMPFSDSDSITSNSQPSIPPCFDLTKPMEK